MSEDPKMPEPKVKVNPDGTVDVENYNTVIENIRVSPQMRMCIVRIIQKVLFEKANVKEIIDNLDITLMSDKMVYVVNEESTYLDSQKVEEHYNELDEEEGWEDVEDDEELDEMEVI